MIAEQWMLLIYRVSIAEPWNHRQTVIFVLLCFYPRLYLVLGIVYRLDDQFNPHHFIQSWQKESYSVVEFTRIKIITSRTAIPVPQDSYFEFFTSAFFSKSVFRFSPVTPLGERIISFWESVVIQNGCGYFCIIWKVWIFFLWFHFSNDHKLKL